MVERWGRVQVGPAYFCWSEFAPRSPVLASIFQQPGWCGFSLLHKDSAILWRSAWSTTSAGFGTVNQGLNKKVYTDPKRRFQHLKSPLQETWHATAANLQQYCWAKVAWWMGAWTEKGRRHEEHVSSINHKWSSKGQLPVRQGHVHVSDAVL